MSLAALILYASPYGGAIVPILSLPKLENNYITVRSLDDEVNELKKNALDRKKWEWRISSRNSLSVQTAELAAGEDIVKKGDMGMIKYDEIVGMPVLSTMEGKDLGKLSEMAICLKNGQVVGFLIEDKNGREMVLPIENVDTYGKDIVLASSESDMKKMDDLAGKAEAIEFAKKIIGLKIITEQGEAFGEIASFCFDEKSGLITHYVTSKGVLSDFMDGKGLLPREGVCAFSLDALVVAQKSVEISDIMKVAPGIKQKTSAVVYETEMKAKAAIRKVEKIVKA